MRGSYKQNTGRRRASARKVTPVRRSTTSKSGTVQTGGRRGVTPRSVPRGGPTLRGRALALARNKGQRGRQMSGKGKPVTGSNRGKVPRDSASTVNIPAAARRVGPVPSVTRKLAPTTRRGKKR